MSIFLTGDTHADFSRFFEFEEYPELLSLTEKDYVIVLGDFGLLWKKDENYAYNKFILEDCPFTILWLDGNHCNFDWIEKFPITENWNGGKVQFITDKIIHLMRGEIYTLENKTFFTCGGARSIDRGHRVPHVSWWEQEEINYQEQENAIKNLGKYNNQVDYILTHAIFPELINPMFHSYNLKAVPEYSGGTEKFLSYIYRVASFKEWYFGHYHLNVDYGKFHCLYEKIMKLE